MRIRIRNKDGSPVRFDIPFCLRSAPLRPSSTSSSSSGRLLCTRLAAGLILSSRRAEQRELGFSADTAWESKKRSDPRLIPPQPREPIFYLGPLHLCLRTYRHSMYVIPIIRYKVLLAYAISQEIARTFVTCLRVNAIQRSSFRVATVRPSESNIWESTIL